MSKRVDLNDIVIRTELVTGDIGVITYLHGLLYKAECGFGVSFEAYVAQGLAEFYKQYDPGKDRVWICEHGGQALWPEHRLMAPRIVGFLALMHRDIAVAQLRYFLLLPEFRGIGLGKKLMGLYMEQLKHAGYRSTYLWTTREQETAISLYKRYGFQLKEEIPSNAFGKPLYEQRYELNVY